MGHSCETFANGVLEALAAHRGAGTVANNARIVAGFHPTWDDEDGAVTLTHDCGPETMVRLEASVAEQPKWLTLNLDLGVGAFEPGDVIGIVAEIAGDDQAELTMFIRTSGEHGEVDTELAEPLALAAAPRVATALHTVGPGDNLAGEERFHMLGMRLPRRDFKLDIKEMRVFVLPAGHGLRSRPMTLAGAAG